jgi:hypothetical protein
MPPTTYTGIGEVFHGDQSLGKYRYEISAATPPVVSHTLTGVSLGEGLARYTGWIDIGQAQVAFYDLMMQSAQLRLILQTGETCTFYLPLPRLYGPTRISMRVSHFTPDPDR